MSTHAATALAPSDMRSAPARLPLLFHSEPIQVVGVRIERVIDNITHKFTWMTRAEIAASLRSCVRIRNVCFISRPAVRRPAMVSPRASRGPLRPGKIRISNSALPLRLLSMPPPVCRYILPRSHRIFPTCGRLLKKKRSIRGARSPSSHAALTDALDPACFC